MWWIIGIILATIVFYFIVRLPAAARHAQLVTAAQDHLRVSFRMLNMFGQDIDERVWTDPYLLGYAQGSIALMTKMFGGKLTTVQSGMIFVDSIKGLVGERYKEVCARTRSLLSGGNSDFQPGLANGGDVAILMAGRAGPALLADPDVQDALREAPAASGAAEGLFGLSQPSAHGAAGGVLLSNYMARHKRELGW